LQRRFSGSKLVLRITLAGRHAEFEDIVLDPLIDFLQHRRLFRSLARSRIDQMKRCRLSVFPGFQFKLQLGSQIDFARKRVLRQDYVCQPNGEQR
jgi:hypothetical protein